MFAENNVIQLEERKCHCGRLFKSMKDSSQEICSNYCLGNIGWKHKNQYKKSEKDIKNGILREKKIQNLERKKMKGGVFPIGKTWQDHAEENAKIIKKTRINTMNLSALNGLKTNNIESKKMLNAWNGQNRTEKDKMQSTEKTMQETKKEPDPAFMKIEENETQPMECKSLSINLNKTTSDSMNSLQSMTNELMSLMKNLNPPLENRDNTTKLLESHRVSVSANVAKQIICSMRLQLDLLKFANEIKKDMDG